MKKNTKNTITKILAVLSIILGLYLFLDSVWLRAINYDYAKVGLQWLDPYISHWMWGLMFLILGLLVLW